MHTFNRKHDRKCSYLRRWKITLKYVLNKDNVRVCTGFIWPLEEESYEYVSKFSGSKNWNSLTS
jgi:hypothetical protein